MTDVFRVPGSWDNTYPKSISDSRRYFDQDSVFSSDSASIYSKETLYKKFITMAKGGNKNNNSAIGNGKNNGKNMSKKQNPVTVRVQDELTGDDCIYHFPYEYANTWDTFQTSLKEAFPEFNKQITKGDLMIISKSDECAFIPQHFNNFIKPGQELQIKFRTPISTRQLLIQQQKQQALKQKLYQRQQQEQLQYEYPSDDSEEDSRSHYRRDSSVSSASSDSRSKPIMRLIRKNKTSSSPGSPRSPRSGGPRVQKIANWLTE